MKNSQKTTKGMSSAVILSILIHAGLFLLAGMLVVFTVVKKQEQNFEPPKAVERPKMKLKKPKVRVKKSSRPKASARIVTKANRQSMPNIELPEMSGLGDGLGDGLGGDGFDMMPDLGTISVFGGGQTIGNDFAGTLYNLNRGRNGNLIPMDRNTFLQKLRNFVLSGWKTRELKEYYRAPKQIYTTHFIIPEVPSIMAPDVFGAPDMESYFFMLHYKGQLVSPEPITFRFWGIGDAYIMVSLNGEEIFLDCGNNARKKSYFDWWHSTSADSNKYFLSNKRMVVGDWITLEAGKPLEMNVMFGEWLGGAMSAMLAVEVQGMEYETNRQGGPILPAFKTAEFSEDLLDEIYEHLSENEICLTNGPVFSDYSIPKRVSVESAPPSAPEPEPEPATHSETPMRTWTLTANGRTLEAELKNFFAGTAILKESNGRTIKIKMDELIPEDQTFIQLENPPEFDISFSKQSEQRIFADPLAGWASTFPRPSALRYTFAANVKQSSTSAYDQELHVDFFVIGAEINGNQYILLDRHQASFTPSEGNDRSIRVSGGSVELQKYSIGSDGVGWDQRGEKYSSFLVVIRDQRGKIIAYKTPKKWLFENLENLEKLSTGNHFDKTCTRTPPTRPKTLFY